MIELAGTLSNLEWIHQVVKPLLMPALLLLLLQAPIGSNQKQVLIAGLVFSWLGDVFLLFEEAHPLFFIVGLACFLFTHICYIIYFLLYRNTVASWLTKQPAIIIVVVAYISGLFLFLFPHLGSLKIPVLVYALVIGSMLLCSIHLYSRISSPSNKLYLAGALSFVLSDSLLAINKFYMPFFLSHTWIMLTYCTAQYFIISGFLREERLVPL